MSVQSKGVDPSGFSIYYYKDELPTIITVMIVAIATLVTATVALLGKKYSWSIGELQKLATLDLYLMVGVGGSVAFLLTLLLWKGRQKEIESLPFDEKNILQSLNEKLQN